MLYKGNKYILELFLCRILFQSDRTILWYLDTPTRIKNKNIYSQTLGGSEKIPYDIVSKIKIQQENFHGVRSFNRVLTGYLIAKDSSFEHAFEKLRLIIMAIIESETDKNERSISALEGIANEQRRILRSRSRKYIEPVKQRENYTCQTCGLKMSVNGKHILQIHHLTPLSKETITTTDDLACLCPTCHLIAHQRVPPYTLVEIRQFIVQHRGSTLQA